MEIRRRSGSLGMNAALSARMAQDGLLEECADKNIIDKDDYPQTAEIEELQQALDALQQSRGLDIPIHVDGARAASWPRSTPPSWCGISA